MCFAPYWARYMNFCPKWPFSRSKGHFFGWAMLVQNMPQGLLASPRSLKCFPWKLSVSRKIWCFHFFRISRNAKLRVTNYVTMTWSYARVLHQVEVEEQARSSRRAGGTGRGWRWGSWGSSSTSSSSSSCWLSWWLWQLSSYSSTQPGHAGHSVTIPSTREAEKSNLSQSLFLSSS